MRYSAFPHHGFPFSAVSRPAVKHSPPHEDARCIPPDTAYPIQFSEADAAAQRYLFHMLALPSLIFIIAQQTTADKRSIFLNSGLHSF